MTREAAQALLRFGCGLSAQSSFTNSDLPFAGQISIVLEGGSGLNGIKGHVPMGRRGH
jgi:hypothetical protein